MSFLMVSYFVATTAQQVFYNVVPISFYYEGKSFTVSDICYGDTEQEFTYTRELGWHIPHGTKATITTELFEVKPGKYVSIYENSVESSNPPTEEVFVVRMPIPEMKVGVYQWTTKYVARFPHDQTPRTDIPMLVSNVFTVKYCAV